MKNCVLNTSMNLLFWDNVVQAESLILCVNCSSKK